MDEGKPVDVTDEDFDDVVNKSRLPLVLEFWSPKCTHCKRMANTVDALANEYVGELLVAKVNVLENPVSAGKYGISNIPAFFYVRGGRVVSKAVGAMSKGRLKEELGLNVAGIA